jgi:hypothetical protein
LGSFKDLCIHRDRQRETTLVYAMLYYNVIHINPSPNILDLAFLWILMILIANRLLRSSSYMISSSIASKFLFSISIHLSFRLSFDHHHQPFNVPPAGEQAFFIDYLQGERAITYHAGPVWIGTYVLMNAIASGTNGLTCLLKKGGARENNFLVTHPMTEECCLASAIARRAHWPRGPRAPPTSHRYCYPLIVVPKCN